MHCFRSSDPLYSNVRHGCVTHTHGSRYTILTGPPFLRASVLHLPTRKYHTTCFSTYLSTIDSASCPHLDTIYRQHSGIICKALIGSSITPVNLTFISLYAARNPELHYESTFRNRSTDIDLQKSSLAVSFLHPLLCNIRHKGPLQIPTHVSTASVQSLDLSTFLSRSEDS